MWQRIQTVADIAINHILTREIQSITKKLLTKFCTKQEFERSTNRSWSISGRHFVHQSTRVWRSPIPVYRRSRRFGGKITKASDGYPAPDKICKLVSEECRFSERAGECGVVHFSTQFFYFEDGSNSMKGGSREAKEDKSTGGGRTWYEKQKTLTPCPPPPPTHKSPLKRIPLVHTDPKIRTHWDILQMKNNKKELVN